MSAEIDEAIRRTAAWALSRIAPTKAESLRGHLVEALHPDQSRAVTAVHALTRFDRVDILRTSGDLLEVVSSSRPRVVMEAIAILDLFDVRSAEARELLQRLVKSGEIPMVVARARALLSKSGW